MKKTIFLALTMALMIVGVSLSYAMDQGDMNTLPTAANQACSIACYEKTPSCYVAKDKSGCLEISDKPICTKGFCTCSIKSCNVKTTYTSHGKSTTMTPN